MIKTAVIGHPIGHSKSPLIHNHWIKKNQLDGMYEAVDIAPENLKGGVQDLIDQGYAGFNVTIPHKEAIVDLCAEIDEAAQRIGAVNTVVIKDGKLYGSNTDAFGFITNLKTHAPDFDFTAGPALVLGAGGAARAVVAGLLDAGVSDVIVTNRTRGKAEAIADHVIDWDQREGVLAGINLLVNTTALGMDGQPPLDLDLAALNKDALVTDIVYKPLETNLLKTAKARGNPTVSGIGMLLHQARPGFEAWHGVMPEVDADLERLVLT